ncbi:uncharacterized protein isoform X2 [Choristoneura fumiferana]|uniref:uncharacterized protein isoform X2 n=1 Tax=Choristoneura fumiferana TaxID=7141 RepID=UPI003D15C1E3
MMIVQKIISFAKRLEDSKYPLLGPNLKGLYVFGLWQSGSKLRNSCYNFIHFCAFLFVFSQIVELWIIRHDYLEALHNLSLTALGMVCIFKAISYVLWQSDWKELVECVSAEEIAQIRNQNDRCAEMTASYKKYARIVTYLYWNVVVSTNIAMVSAPFVKYASSPEYRELISNGTEPLPQIFSSWFPFDKSENPGYFVAIFVHILINIYGGGVIALYDSNAVALMVFIRGQLAILREKCKILFDDIDNVTRRDVFDRIKECHRHHNFIVRQSVLLNSLLSPVMFLYILVCSGMICCNVIQFTSCNDVDRGLYESDWWKGDVRIRKQLVILGGKLKRSLAFSAGPFTTLCVPTFIEVIKGSYSFFTLLTQMQEK